jgi:hypothetical protein
VSIASTGSGAWKIRESETIPVYEIRVLKFWIRDLLSLRKNMTLREVTRTVIKLVEDASGCSVVVNEDRSIPAWRLPALRACSRSCLRTNVDSRVGIKNRLNQPIRDIATREDDSVTLRVRLSGSRWM